jgi:demethylmenaquinone methyltransferase/2-methoxy-6-polyprenyl-1,4-benzoquinol methylase
MDAAGGRVTTSQSARALFDANAGTYDHVNLIITFGLDRRWRRWAARRALALAAPDLAAPPAAAALDAVASPTGNRRSPRVLDAFAGSGLISLELAARGAEVTAADISPRMLTLARERAAAAGLRLAAVEIDLAGPDRAALPWPSHHFAAITLGFGLRYVAEPAAVLRDLAATLAPDGAIVLLEAVRPPAGPIGAVAAFYFFSVVPRLATRLAGRGELYARLAESVRAIGSAADVRRIVESAGLIAVETRQFAAGLVVGVVARRP